MAVIHPQDRFARPRREGKPLHPAFGLLVGFGFIFAIATLVHIVFNVVV